MRALVIYPRNCSIANTHTHAHAHMRARTHTHTHTHTHKQTHTCKHTQNTEIICCLYIWTCLFHPYTDPSSSHCRLPPLFIGCHQRSHFLHMHTHTYTRFWLPSPRYIDTLHPLTSKTHPPPRCLHHPHNDAYQQHNHDWSPVHTGARRPPVPHTQTPPPMPGPPMPQQRPTFRPPFNPTPNPQWRPAPPSFGLQPHGMRPSVPPGAPMGAHPQAYQQQQQQQQQTWQQVRA